jgi:cyclopropane fatty-acyl-phospholipid synthase-like methyltransferase
VTERDGVEWWDTYFDERFIALYAPLLPEQESRAEAEAAAELLGLEAGARVLDLACGWGRHAVELARAGYRVTGVDRSETLLSHARRAAAAAGVEVEWVCADVRDVPASGDFDAVVSLFSSLGYFLSDEEDARALRAARGALRSDGLLLLETMHRDQVARSFAEHDWWESPDGTLVWVEREFDAVAGVSHERLRWRSGAGEGEKRHSIRVRTATEWARLLHQAGLEPLAWYGDWEPAAFEHTSERLIVLAEPA